MSEFGSLYSEIIESIEDGIIAIDAELNIQLINSYATTLLGAKPGVSELEGVNLLDLIEDIHDLKAELELGAEEGLKSFTLINSAHNGRFLTFNASILSQGLLITIQDITALKIMEQSIMTSMLEGQEMERRRLSKELHDGCGPLLSTVKLQLEAVTNDETNKSLRDKKLAEAIQVLDTLGVELRSISHALMPRVLEDFGLIDAIDTLVKSINTTGKIKLTFFYSRLVKRLDRNIEFAIYRIVQELINNTLKHAKATDSNLQLIEHQHMIVLMFEDNGVGFNKSKIVKQNSGIGLDNIEARVQTFGGNFYIDSHLNKGCTATVEIPI